MKKFDHIRVGSYEEADRVIQEGDGRVEPIAGGTDLLGTLKDRLLPTYPEGVVSLKGIPDSAYIVSEDGDSLSIGAGTTLKEIAESQAVREHCPALAEAARSVASPLIRNTATIGGNLCQDVRCWYYRSTEIWTPASSTRNCWTGIIRGARVIRSGLRSRCG